MRYMFVDTAAWVAAADSRIPQGRLCGKRAINGWRPEAY